MTVLICRTSPHRDGHVSNDKLTRPEHVWGPVRHESAALIAEFDDDDALPQDAKRQLLLLLTSRESIRELCFQAGMNMLRTAEQLDTIAAAAAPEGRQWCQNLAQLLKTRAKELSLLRDLLNVNP